MDIEQALKSNFSNINKSFFQTENGIEFLKIEVNLIDLNKITSLSKEISLFIDKNLSLDKNYYLDIYSPGSDKEFHVKDSKEYIGENIRIILNKHIKNKEEFIGELLSFENNEIIIKWNNKGQFRKQTIDIEQIQLITKYIKIKKKG